MKFIRLIAAAFIAFAPSAVLAQAGGPTIDTSAVLIHTDAGWDAHANIIAVNPTQAQGGIINIGQAFGPVAEPYIDAVVNALIAAGVAWLGYFLNNTLHINIDKGHRDALTQFIQGRANSLIADGMVKLDGVKVSVPNQAVVAEVNLAATMIPDAVAHFGVTPDQLAAKIVDAIPHVPAGAAMVANAHAAAPAAA